MVGSVKIIDLVNDGDEIKKIKYAEKKKGVDISSSNIFSKSWEL